MLLAVKSLLGLVFVSDRGVNPCQLAHVCAVLQTMVVQSLRLPFRGTPAGAQRLLSVHKLARWRTRPRPTKVRGVETWAPSVRTKTSMGCCGSTTKAPVLPAGRAAALPPPPPDDAGAAHPAAAGRAAPIVTCSYGRLRGAMDELARDHDVAVFRGVPYARMQRFGEPTQPASWEGVREATKEGPAPPCAPWAVHKGAVRGCGFPKGDMSAWIPVEHQDSASPPGFESETEGLNLNIWAPAKALKGASSGASPKLPVLFWLPGGAFFMRGNPICAPVSNGSHLAAEDCVVVACNRRTFAMGFLYKEGSDIPPNLGLLDVVAALEWVKREIAAFGGDPDNVTIWGESEGAVEVLLLLGSPYCVERRLFHRAKSDSGPWVCQLLPVDCVTVTNVCMC